ncbi:MAG: M23 family metallopeptidase, partial [Actinomycetota bacterium]|nr:M23 family metallopeptidase [Actinomycetota bacterium]
ALDAAVAARRDAVAAARDAVAEDQRRYDEMRAVAARLRAEAVRQTRASLGTAAQGSVRAVPGRLRAPVSGAVTSPYGMRVHPVTGVYKLHTGTDFAGPCSTPVDAALAGTVSEVGYDGAYGNRVVVIHGVVDGVWLATTYNHLSRTVVRPGDAVANGTTLGVIGSTGYSTGCHLHLELLVNGEFTDPEPWL